MERTTLSSKLFVITLSIVAGPFGILGPMAEPAAAQAEVSFLVNSGLDAVDAAPGDGTCAAADGACTLRAAVQEANALAGPNTIAFDAALNGIAITLTLAGAGEDAGATGDLDVNGPTTLVGNGAANTIVEGCDASADPACTGLDRLFDFADGQTVTMTGLTLRNGHGLSEPFSRSGGALRVQRTLSWEPGYAGRTTATLEDVVVTNSDTVQGGGGILSVGTLTLRRVTMTGNAAPDGSGGAVKNDVGGTLYVYDSTFTDNLAVSGGAILSNSGSAVADVTIVGSTFADNVATSHGGALYNNGYANAGTFRITQSTFSGNTATQFGGAIFTSSAIVHIASSTFAANDAPAGGTISNQIGVYSSTAPVTIRNSIVTGSGSPNCEVSGAGATITSHGHNLDSGTSCGFSAPGDLASADAGLGPLALRGGATPTHDLLPTSAAVDAGDAAGCLDLDGNALATDQRGPGFPRSLDGDLDGVSRCDIGAYETTRPVPALLGIAGTTLYALDVETPEAIALATIGPLSGDVYDAAWDLATGSLFVLQGIPPRLYSVNVLTMATTDIGPITVDGVEPYLATGLTVNPVTGQMWTAVGGEVRPGVVGRLAVLDRATGAATEVTPLSGLADGFPDALEWLAGELYAIDDADGVPYFYRLDPASGQATRIGGTPPFGPISDLVDDAGLHGIRWFANEYVTIDPATAATSVVASFPALDRIRALAVRGEAGPDTVPPVLDAVDDIVLEATGPDGAEIADATPNAVDDRSGVVPVRCTPAAVGTFPVGDTTVRCTATDAAGNQAAEEFVVAVLDTVPPTTTATLVGDLRAPDLYRGAVSLELACAEQVGPCSTWMRVGDAPAALYEGPVAFSERGVYVVSFWSEDRSNVEPAQALGFTIAVAPSEPTALGATAGNRRITVHWAAPTDNGGAPVIAYEVYGGATPDSLSLLARLGDVRSFTETGLGLGATRHYAVRAINAVDGGPSAVASATTWNVPSAPRNVAAAPGTAPGSYVVSWEPPTSDGGTPITTYYVYRRCDGRAFAPVGTTGPDARSLLDGEGCRLGSTATYSVYARNNVGMSAPGSVTVLGTRFP